MDDWETLAYMSLVGRVQLVPLCVALRSSVRRLSVSWKVAQIEETGELEEVEAVWSSRKTRHCENTLLWPADSHAQDSRGMVEAVV